MQNTQYNATLPSMLNVIEHSDHKDFKINWFHIIRYSEFIKHTTGLNSQML